MVKDLGNPDIADTTADVIILTAMGQEAAIDAKEAPK
jgi:hypothetical protein